ncbi:uncharacterized protein LOC126807647 [Patella vulgata]|uniref:uncharacterized protein LOC126807647 n=1 Tax=Patella vulgata TaxID=6465 RepID=UPI0024A8CE69|nr:uncharacterized protein LOC126807647 [Patella vulgata]
MLTPGAGDRPDVPNAVVVITDSTANENVESTIASAKALRESGTTYEHLPLKPPLTNESKVTSHGEEERPVGPVVAGLDLIRVLDGLLEIVVHQDQAGHHRAKDQELVGVELEALVLTTVEQAGLQEQVVLVEVDLELVEVDLELEDVEQAGLQVVLVEVDLELMDVDQAGLRVVLVEVDPELVDVDQAGLPVVQVELEALVLTTVEQAGLQVLVDLELVDVDQAGLRLVVVQVVLVEVDLELVDVDLELVDVDQAVVLVLVEVEQAVAQVELVDVDLELVDAEQAVVHLYHRDLLQEEPQDLLDAEHRDRLDGELQKQELLVVGLLDPVHQDFLDLVEADQVGLDYLQQQVARPISLSCFSCLRM